MRNKLLLAIIVIMALVWGCDKDNLTKSTVVTTSVPIVGVELSEPSYVFGLGSGTVNKTIPDTLAIAVDSIYGFEKGFGGKTGKDSIYMLKSQMIGGWPDTSKVGAYSLNFEAFNSLNYKAKYTVNVIIAGPIEHPGPTDISGKYERTSNHVLIDILKVFDGVYVIDNPGGATGVPLRPYLLYNYENSAGGDSLSFATQAHTCGGLKIVSPSASPGLTSEEYDKSYPPAITVRNPLTLSWKVFEFPSLSPSAVSPDGNICTYGQGVRTFVKQ